MFEDFGTESTFEVLIKSKTYKWGLTQPHSLEFPKRVYKIGLSKLCNLSLKNCHFV